VANDGVNHWDRLGLSNDTVEVIWGHNRDIKNYLDAHGEDGTPRCFSGCSANFLNDNFGLDSEDHFVNNGAGPNADGRSGTYPNETRDDGSYLFDSVTRSELNDVCGRTYEYDCEEETWD